MTWNDSELEPILTAMLDRLAEGSTLIGASRVSGHGDEFIKRAIKQSEAGDKRYVIAWRDESPRQFAELCKLAQAIGDVRRDQELRTIRINGEVQYVVDPTLKARFIIYGDDAADVAELNGYKDWPFAHDIDGNRIPLLSVRHPRPGSQFPRPFRPHRPQPPAPLPQWTPSSGVPPYAKTVKAAVPPPRVIIRSEASPLVADLRARLERGVENPRAEGPLSLAHGYIGPQRADDPKEQITGASE